MYHVIIESEMNCESVTYDTFNEAWFWSRYYQWLPGVWRVYVTDDSWSLVLYETGVLVDLI